MSKMTPGIDTMTFNEWIGAVLYALGRRPNVSTGICGSTTYGYGRLDANGYWQYPAYEVHDA